MLHSTVKITALTLNEMGRLWRILSRGKALSVFERVTLADILNIVDRTTGIEVDLSVEKA